MSKHNQIKERIAKEYENKGYNVIKEYCIGNRRVDIYAENETEVIIIEIVDTHYSGPLSNKEITELKIRLKEPVEEGLPMKTKVNLNTPTSPSLRTTIPTGIAEFLGLSPGDEVDWGFMKVEGRTVIVVSKV